MNAWEYIRPDYHGTPFELFGRAHVATLGAIALFIAGLLRFRGADAPTRRRVRMALALCMIASELSWHLWAYEYVGWTLSTMLPLHLCSALVWITAYTLLTMNVAAYEFVYFMGISGPLQAILTPDAGRYGLPHYRALQTLGAHGLLIAAALWLTVVEGLRPTPRSIPRVVLGTLLYMVAVTAVNVAVGGNYMFTLRKPPTASLLDALGPWPWYLVPMILAGTCCVVLLYLPFWWSDRRRTAPAGTSGPQSS